MSGARPLQVDVLYFVGCPHHQATIDQVREVLLDLEIEAEVHEVVVRDSDEAARRRFLGSPSIRVEGLDIEPEARGRTDFALSCRLYDGSGLPPRELLVAALQRFRNPPKEEHIA